MTRAEYLARIKARVDAQWNALDEAERVATEIPTISAEQTAALLADATERASKI